MKNLLARLKKEPIRNIKFSRGWISFEYDGKKLKNEIIIERHQKFVGRWDKVINAVYVDDDLEEVDMEAVAVHETVEKYVSQKYAFKIYKEAHDIASIKEKEFIERNKGDWKSHQIRVGKVWKKESKISH